MEFYINRTPIIILLEVLSNSSILPYFIWKGLFYINNNLQDKQTYYLIFSEYHNNTPKSYLAYSNGKYLFIQQSILKSIKSHSSAYPYNPYKPFGLDSTLFI
jgi:hypothetical protein